MANIGKSKSSQKSVNISKGLLYLFFTVYLIIFGIIMTGFIETFQTLNPSVLPTAITYIPLAFYVGAIFLGLGFIIFLRNTTAQKSRETKSRKAKTGSIYRKALFLIIFIFAFIPILSPLIDQGVNDHFFSVHNSKWNGCSGFRQQIESQGYEVMSIQSSLSAVDRIDKSICLVLLGPNQLYNPIFEIPFFIDFFSDEDHKNSLLLAHDHGSTYELLWEIFIANLLNWQDINNPANIFPVTIFADGILRDNSSCLKNEAGDGDSAFPIIRNFDSAHPTTAGIDEVILSHASAAAGGQLLIESVFGWDVIGQTSLDNSFVDKNNNGKYDYDNATGDFTDSISLEFINTMLVQMNITAFEDHEDFLHFPLGSSIFAPVTFLAKELINNRVFVTSDASLFSNDLINSYDNLQFGLNIIDWLTYNGVDDPNDWIIAFDEAHIRPELTRDLSSAGIYGFIMQYIIHLSTNPITAWIYPLLAIYTLRKYLPKKDEESEKKRIEEEEKKEEKEKFRTSSFFAQKIDWYKEKGRYGKALTLLYRRVERKLNAQLSGTKITTLNVINLIKAKEAGGRVSKLKIRRISRFMDRMLAIKAGKSKVKNPEEFENLFLEMSWVMKNI